MAPLAFYLSPCALACHRSQQFDPHRQPLVLLKRIYGLIFQEHKISIPWDRSIRHREGLLFRFAPANDAAVRPCKNLIRVRTLWGLDDVAILVGIFTRGRVYGKGYGAIAFREGMKGYNSRAEGFAFADIRCEGMHGGCDLVGRYGLVVLRTATPRNLGRAYPAQGRIPKRSGKE